jgi:PAS domain S-box-containing protein
MLKDSELDAFPCGIYAIGENNVITAWNREMSRITGYTREEMMGRDASLVQFHDPSNKDNLINPFQCAAVGNSPFLSRAVYIEDRTSKLRLGYIQAVNANHLDEQSAQILVTVSDISKEISCAMLEDSSLVPSEGSHYGIVGGDPKFLEIIKLIDLAAESMANILISGESGTGKELIAKAIHLNSPRSEKPFVTVNCSALPESLLESELFGHVRGAFTGAYRDKVGKFEAAEGGTIFLDEIGDISSFIQLKLLRVIQEKSIERVGDNRRIDVDMRIITATNRDLRRLVSEGEFREDLYYRLKVFPIQTMPLRDRKNDIPLLCQHFIKKFNRKTGKNIKGLTENAMKLLMDYCWPGNVRELENCVEYAFVLSSNPLIDIFDLPQDIRVLRVRDELCREREPQNSASRTGRSYSREELLRHLEENNWNKAQTARKLEISRVTLWKKLKSLGIEDP